MGGSSTDMPRSKDMGMMKKKSDMNIQNGNQQAGMIKMIKQMNEINASNDFDKRDELIANHYISMNKGIKEMCVVRLTNRSMSVVVIN